MVKVYAHWALNSETAQTEIAPHKRTVEGVKLVPGGKIIPETVEDVDAALVDDRGRYMAEWRGE